MKKLLSILLVLLSLFSFIGCSAKESLIPYNHMPEELSVGFKENVTIEEAMAFAKDHGATIVEDQFEENGLTLVAPWFYWNQPGVHVVRMRFSGASDEDLLKLVDELSVESGVEFVKIVAIVKYDG